MAKVAIKINRLINFCQRIFPIKAVLKLKSGNMFLRVTYEQLFMA